MPLPALDEALARRATQRRGPVRLLRRPAAAAQADPRLSPPASGAAAWLPDHLPQPAQHQLALTYTAERLLLLAFALVVSGLVSAVAIGMLAAATVATALAVAFLALGLTLTLRFLGLLLHSAKCAALLRLWRARLRLAPLEGSLRLLNGGLAWLDRREARQLAVLDGRWQDLLRQERATFAALDSALGRFATERQQLDRAEEEEVARTLRDRRQRLLAGELSGYTILSSGIPGIGPQAKLHLLSAGIRNAAQILDVRARVVQSGGGSGPGGELVEIEVPGRGLVRVDGIGRKKAQALLAWRRQLETASHVALPDALPATDEAVMRRRYHNRRRALDRQESEARQRAERQKEGRRRRLRRRRATFDCRAAAIHARIARLRHPLTSRQTVRQERADTAQLALALARRELAAYDELRFGRYLRRIVLR